MAELFVLLILLVVAIIIISAIFIATKVVWQNFSDLLYYCLNLGFRMVALCVPLLIFIVVVVPFLKSCKFDSAPNYTPIINEVKDKESNTSIEQVSTGQREDMKEVNTPITGVIIEARGFNPSYTPILCSKEGDVLYTPQESDWSKKFGYISYCKNVSQALKLGRVGEHPVILKAVRASGNKILLEDPNLSDSKRIVELFYEGRIVVLP